MGGEEKEQKGNRQQEEVRMDEERSDELRMTPLASKSTCVRTLV